MNTTSTKGLKVGDIFKVTKKAHTATNNVFKFISYTENGSIRAVKYPNYYGQGDPITISDLTESGVKKLSKEEIKNIPINPTRQFANGGKTPKEIYDQEQYDAMYDSTYGKGGGLNSKYEQLHNKYREDNDWDNSEPMDGDDTEKMANEIAENENWSMKNKKAFLKYADEREGNMAYGGGVKGKTPQEVYEQEQEDAMFNSQYAKGSTVKGNYVPKGYKGQLYDVFAIKNGKWEKLNDEVGGLTKKHAENMVNAINKGDGQNFTKGYSEGYMDKEGVRSFQKYAKGSTITADVKAILDAKRAKIKQRKSKRKQ